MLVLLGLPVIATIAFYCVAYSTGIELFERFFLAPILVIFVASCIGLGETTKWLLRFNFRLRDRHIKPSTSVGSANGVLVMITVILTLVIEHRNLPLKISGFDTFARWRISAVSAASAVLGDSDYRSSTPVIVRVEDFALVGWLLRSDGRNLTESLQARNRSTAIRRDCCLFHR